jgi:hypothetical protein
MSQLEFEEIFVLSQRRKSSDLLNDQMFTQKINGLSMTKVRNVVTEKIVQFDTQACLDLLNKIDEDNSRKKKKQEMLSTAIDNQRKRFSR